MNLFVFVIVTAKISFLVLAVLGLINPRAIKKTQHWSRARIFFTYLGASILVFAVGAIGEFYVPRISLPENLPPAFGESLRVDLPRYTIIIREEMPPHKTVFYIRLQERVTESQLGRLAKKIKRDGRSKNEYTFILYYLPGMDHTSMAWATTHYSPDLDIEIIGATIEEAP